MPFECVTIVRVKTPLVITNAFIRWVLAIITGFRVSLWGVPPAVVRTAVEFTVFTIRISVFPVIPTKTHSGTIIACPVFSLR